MPLLGLPEINDAISRPSGPRVEATVSRAIDGEVVRIAANAAQTSLNQCLPKSHPPVKSQPVNCDRRQTLRLPDVSVSVNTVQSKNNEAGTIYQHRFGSFLGYQLTGGELGARRNYGDA
jgi:hypothetical protein